MKTDHLKESNNIEDRRNEGGSASYGSGNARLGNGILRILLAPGSFKRYNMANREAKLD